MPVRVATASETVASERAAMEQGVSPAELMRRAGEGAADVVARRYGEAAKSGVVVFAGPGNNGGDGWVTAHSLFRTGLTVAVREAGLPKTDEAQAARARAMGSGGIDTSSGFAHTRGLVIDAVLGTGSSGAPRGAAAEAIAVMNGMRRNGSIIVSLDLPSGVDSNDGSDEGSVAADMTISFGTMKRGHLLAREKCGRVIVTDIGLDTERSLSRSPVLVDAAWVQERVPRIPATAHKGTRKRLTIVGGGQGMAGAAILGGEGALRSGIGLLRIATATGNEVAVHAGIPAAIVERWPSDPDSLARIVENSDAIAIGPGLGSSGTTRDLVERILMAWSGPVVLDADALNVFAGDMLSLSQLLRGRAAVITPHPAELARLMSVPTEEVSRGRFDIGLDVSAQLGAAVLLKGTPTVVFSPGGERYVSASGTAALATGGSGDVLTGMTGTLVAQMTVAAPERAAVAAACAAFIHGRAAEMCGAVRGVTLDDVLRAMPRAWNSAPPPLADGVIAELGAAA